METASLRNNRDGKENLVTEESKAIVKRVSEEAVGGGDLSVMDELAADDFVDHSALPGTPPGREGAKAFVRVFHAGFPDLSLTNEDIIGEGGKVVHRYVLRGTHEGEFIGIPPTGNRVEVHGIDELRVFDGKIVERWGQVDQLGLMQQLGVIPPPEQAGA
jgi:predicted ester cyclase